VARHCQALPRLLRQLGKIRIEKLNRGIRPNGNVARRPALPNFNLEGLSRS
jgi:hypothetical protein